MTGESDDNKTMDAREGKSRRVFVCSSVLSYFVHPGKESFLSTVEQEKCDLATGISEEKDKASVQ